MNPKLLPDSRLLSDTWRYRLWQWLRSNDINFRFVGPYRGTHKPTPPSTPQAPSPEEQPEAWSSNGSYAPGVDSSFISTRHFCQWGYQTAQAKDTIAAQVFAFQPDYLLVVLGFNDLGWFVSGPDELLSDMKNLVDNARGVKSNVKFAIADVPHRTRLDGRQDLIDGTEKYNGKLAEAIHEWSTEDSPVRLVGFCENYDCRSRVLFSSVFADLWLLLEGEK